MRPSTYRTHRLVACALALTAVAVPGSGQRLAGLSFTDVTTQSGVSFKHASGAAGAKWYPELFGGGVAVLDADGDLAPDLLMVNGRDWTSDDHTRHGLFRNARNGSFQDRSAQSGLDQTRIYALGASVADYDNDGRDDVFMTTADGGRLFHNEGNARFTDVTERAGIRNTEFSVSSAWFDADRDGRVDLLIGNYVRWSPALEVVCAQGGERGYCGPDAYRPTAPKLYRNMGSGRFEDMTERAGLADPTDKAMGLAILDYNGDRWPDIFIGSDRVPAKLYRNDGAGRFIDEGVRAGVALSENGVARANMGVDAADFDRSGRPHIAVGNFLNEMLGLYRNIDGRRFIDVAPRSDVGRASLLNVTWAVFFFDADLDGYLDLFALNGGTDESQAMDARARLSQSPLLLRNRGTGTFENVSAQLGSAFSSPIMGRGAAYVDFDGDGDLDLSISTLNGPAKLLRNDGSHGHGWLRVRTIGRTSNRSGIGAVVRVSSAGGSQWQMVHSGSSYASQSELTLTFGLGTDRAITRLDVEWPSGGTQSFTDVPINRLVTIDERAGIQLTGPTPRATGAGALPR